MRTLLAVFLSIFWAVTASGQMAASVRGDCDLSRMPPLTLYSSALAQYFNSLGVEDDIPMQGYHVIASSTGVPVDELQWHVWDGRYSGLRQGASEYNTCYDAANNGRAYPVGLDPDEEYVVDGGPWLSGRSANQTIRSRSAIWAAGPPAATVSVLLRRTFKNAPPIAARSFWIFSVTAFGPREQTILLASTSMLMARWIGLAGSCATAMMRSWRDVEKNQRIDDGSELFGVGMTLPDGNRARDGFEALAAYDRVINGGNGDGHITNADRIWHRLRLWRDANHNGVSEKPEIFPIQSACVVSFDLAWIRSSDVDLAGNQHRMVSTYLCRVGGAPDEQRALVDVFFRRH